MTPEEMRIKRKTFFRKGFTEARPFWPWARKK